MGRRDNKLALVYEKGWSWGEGEGETSEDKLCAVDMAPSLPSEKGSRRLSDWASQYAVYT